MRTYTRDEKKSPLVTEAETNQEYELNFSPNYKLNSSHSILFDKTIEIKN